MSETQNQPEPAEGNVTAADIQSSGQEVTTTGRPAVDHRNPLLLTPAERRQQKEDEAAAEKRSQAARKAAETRRRNASDD